MIESGPFDYSPSGDFLLVADGSDVVVYDGLSERALWVGNTSAEVRFAFLFSDGAVALSADGKLTTWSSEGRVRSIQALDATEAIGFDVSRDTSVIAVLLPDQLLLIRDADPSSAERISVPQARNVCCASSGEWVAVGFSDGRLYVLDPHKGERVAEVRTGGAPVVDLAYVDAEETWYVLVGSEVLRINALGEPEEVFDVTPHHPDKLAVSADGALIALRMDPMHVRVVRASGELVAEVLYDDRRVGDISFGPGALLGIGLGGGDANKLNLFTGEVFRTDPHPSKTRRAWNLSLDRPARDEPNDWALEPASFDPAFHADERAALGAYHRELAQKDDEPLQLALRNGWVPADPDVLIEAGMRCLPLLDNPSISEEPGKSAHARLESIIARVRTGPATTQSERALVEWQNAIEEAEKRARSDVVLGCALLLGIAAAAVGGVAWLIF